MSSYDCTPITVHSTGIRTVLYVYILQYEVQYLLYRYCMSEESDGLMVEDEDGMNEAGRLRSWKMGK